MVGPAATEESWAPTTFSRQQADDYLQKAPRISMRPPAGRSASNTEPPGSAPIKGIHTNESWWQLSRRSSLPLGTTSIPHAYAQPTRKEEQQGLSPPPPSVFSMADTSAVWPEEPAPEYSNSRISGGSSHNPVSGTNNGIYMQQPAFHPEGHLEIVSKRVGSFEPSGGDAGWRTGTAAEAASGGGPEGWSQPIDQAAAAGLPSSRQASGDLRQTICGKRQPESLNTPSKRLSEMKEYFRRQEHRAPASWNEGSRHLNPAGSVFRSRAGFAVEGSLRDFDAQVQRNGGGCGGEGVNKKGERVTWQGRRDATYHSSASVSSAASFAQHESVAEAIGIMVPPNRDGVENGGRGWDDSAAVWSAASTTAGGHSGGETGIEFDPHTDSRGTQAVHVNGGGSPATAWWKDGSEPMVSAFPWDLHLPNPAPPLAPPHDSTGIRGVSESSMVCVARASPSIVTPGSPTLPDDLQHSPLCRCDECRLGKVVAPHPRHRIPDQQVHPHHTGSLDAIIDGTGRSGGVWAGSGALMDCSSRVPYGGQRWGMNNPQDLPPTSDASWGLGSIGVCGSGVNGSSGDGGCPSGMSKGGGDSHRGGAPLCDTLIPSGSQPAPHDTAPMANARVAPSHQLATYLSGPKPLVRQTINHTHEGREREGELGGIGALRDRGVKRARVNRRGGNLHMFEDEWAGASNGETSPPLVPRGLSSSGSESRSAAGGGTVKEQRGKKVWANSRRCRAEGCRSHPNFGVEGDRRAMYCAKHKLPGMVNVKAPRCRHQSCTRNPVYGNAGDPRATFCLSHKGPLMVDVKNRRCQFPDCTHQPSFGMVGDRRANFCFTHKLPSHVNIRRARARAGGAATTGNIVLVASGADHR